MSKKIQCIDLFSGCGGMSLGFEKAGMKILAAFDNWQPAIDVYKQNFKHKIYNEDLINYDKALLIIKKLTRSHYGRPALPRFFKCR